MECKRNTLKKDTFKYNLKRVQWTIKQSKTDKTGE